MSRSRQLRLSSIFLLCLGCQATPPSDDEALLLAHPEYPESRFLRMVGLASLEETDRAGSFRQADADATAKTASYFSTRISSALQNEVGVVVYGEDQRSLSRSMQKLVGVVSAFSAEDLAAVKVVDHREDRRRRVVFSLVVLDRRKYCEVLSERARTLDLKQQALVEAAESLRATDRNLQAFLLVKRARARAAEVAGLRERFLLAAPRDMSWPGPQRGQLAEVATRILGEFPDGVSVAVALSVSVESQKEDPAIWESRIAERFIEYGLRIEDSSPFRCQGSVVGRASSKYDSKGGSGAIYFYRTSGNCVLLDTKTGETIASVSFRDAEETKCGELTAQKAAMGSLEKAVALLCEKLTAALDQAGERSQ